MFANQLHGSPKQHDDSLSEVWKTKESIALLTRDLKKKSLMMLGISQQGL